MLGSRLPEQESEDEYEESFTCVPVCGVNLSTPVIDKAYYINDIQYNIGDRLYIENTD